MSVDYYVRLEQAHGPRPSPPVLDAITGALRLSPAERTHLFQLAGANPAPPASPARQVRPYVANLLRRIPDAAAVVTDATYDVVAFNPLAEAVLGNCDVLTIPDDDQQVVFITADPGSPTARALRHLAQGVTGATAGPPTESMILS